MKQKKYIPYQTDVLILGLNPTGMGIVRSLRQYEDLNIYGAVLNPRTEKGRFTKSCRVLYWPDPKTDESGFSKTFLVWAALREKVVVFASRDEEVYWLAKNSDRLPPNILYYRNSFDQIRQIDDKALVSSVADACGIKVPKSCFIKEYMDVLPSGFEFPVIIKPSSVPPESFPHKNVIIHHRNEFADILKRYPVLINASVFQEYIPGGDEQVYQCTFLAGSRGSVLGSIEFRKLRQYPVGRGIASFGHTLLHRDISLLCDRLINKTGIKGLVSAEFKKDSRDRQWVFIEANLRMPAYNSVFSETDVSLARIYIDDLLDRHAENRKFENRKIVYWMREELDLANVLKQDVKISLRKWFKEVMHTDVYAFWNKADPFPGFVNFCEIIINILKRLIRR